MDQLKFPEGRYTMTLGDGTTHPLRSNHIKATVKTFITVDGVEVDVPEFDSLQRFINWIDSLKVANPDSVITIDTKMINVIS